MNLLSDVFCLFSPLPSTQPPIWHLAKQHPPRKTVKRAAEKANSTTGKIAKKERVKGMGWRRSSRLNDVPIAFLDNGLISMENTPDHLIPMQVTFLWDDVPSYKTVIDTKSSAAHNAKNSPLLRLPGEIRNQIWELVLKGRRIDLTNLRFPRHDLPFSRPLFALPEVCRQMYVDTAILGYRLNSFLLHADRAHTRLWSDGLIPAQRNAIIMVAFRASFLPFHWDEELSEPRVPLKETFPNLAKIELLWECPEEYERVWTRCYGICSLCTRRGIKTRWSALEGVEVENVTEI